MAISPYVRQLRERVGPMRLLLPSVSAHLFDDAGRLLLVRQRDGGVWSTPGGLIEPDERPADAAVRYGNGDEAQYVIVAVGATVIGGALRPDLEETDAAHWWSTAEAESLPLAPWLRALREEVFAGGGAAPFATPTWSPPA
jgi:hypothetical protein